MQASQTSYQLNHANLVQEIILKREGNAVNDDAFVHWLKFIDDDVLWISMSNGDLVEFNCSTQSISFVHTFDVCVVQACLS